MLKGSCILFSRTTNSQEFSDDCLKDIAKNNKDKVYKIGDGSGVVNNFRYNKGQVIADFSFPNLVINVSGRIDSKVDLPNKVHGLITEFRVKTIELVEKKGK